MVADLQRLTRNRCGLHRMHAAPALAGGGEQQRPYILSASGPELGVPDCRGPLMCGRSMLLMRHAFAEPAPINHTDHHRWRDPVVTYVWY
jgi:hypothetical protein